MKWLMKKRHGGIDSSHARGRFSCLLGVLLLVHTSVWADLQGSITLSLKQATVSEFVEAVQKQYDIGFIYDYNKLKDLHVADIDVEDATIEQVLELALKGTGFVGEIRNGVIVIKKEEKPQQQQVEGAKTIKGKVMDVEGVGLPGVTVLIKGTGLGVATDENGLFSVTVPQAIGQTLVFSFVGMTSKEYVIKDPAREVIIELEESSEEMKEVVVNGIFARDIASFTGSASVYTNEDLKMVAPQNIIQALKSLDPAMAVIESKEWGSDPNRMPQIEIRGRTNIAGLESEYENDPNQPLFILDGMETTLDAIVNLNMDRVASVTILKDAASTAIYGSKAANGVVVVETKAPVAGELRLSYSGNFTLQFADLTDYNLMNAEEKLEFERLGGIYTAESGTGPTNQIMLDNQYYERLAEIRRGVNTYWMAEPLRTVLNHSHNVYIDGGDKDMRYGLGVSYNNANGVMKGSDRQTYGANIDLSYRRGKLLFSNRVNLSITHSEREPAEFSLFSRSNPYYRKVEEDGAIQKIFAYDKEGAAIVNPLYLRTILNTNETNSLSVTNNFQIDWTVLDFLRLKGNIGLEKSVSKNEVFKSPKHPDYEEEEKMYKGGYSRGDNESFRYNGQVTLNFGKMFGKVHRVNAILGWTFSQTKTNNSGYEINGFTGDDRINPRFSTGWRDGDKPDYGENIDRSTSFFFNGNYALKERYLLDLTLRSDGTSTFGANRRFSTTWTVGLAWNMHNEKFVKEHLPFINNFKIRASIGNPGNQNFSSSMSLRTYMYTSEKPNMFGSTAVIDNFGNEDLEWQRTLDKNIGVDMSFFGNRLRVSFDAYHKLTDPMLINVPLPPSVGVTQFDTNVGQQIATGFYGTFSGTIIEKGDLRWNANFNFRTTKSVMEEIGDNLMQYNKQGSSTSLTRYYDGASTDDMWAVPSLGIDPTTGREVYLKKDGTYTFYWDAADEVIVGCSVPKVEGVIGTSLYWKNFTLSMNFRYRLGGQVFATALYDKVENLTTNDIYYNQDKRALYDRWHEPGDVTKFKSIKLQESGISMSSRFVVDENTLSGESISMSYETSGKWVKRLGLDGITFRGYLNEIFRWSSFKEERGIEYPFARSVTLSMSVRF